MIEPDVPMFLVDGTELKPQEIIHQIARSPEIRHRHMIEGRQPRRAEHVGRNNVVGERLTGKGVFGDNLLLLHDLVEVPGTNFRRGVDIPCQGSSLVVETWQNEEVEEGLFAAVIDPRDINGAGTLVEPLGARLTGCVPCFVGSQRPQPGVPQVHVDFAVKVVGSASGDPIDGGSSLVFGRCVQ